MLPPMAGAHAYPEELADYVLAHWPAETPLSVSRDTLLEVLSVCYQASLTSEEGRPTRFRLLLTDPRALPDAGAPKTGALKLLLDERRAFTPEELRRLAPAAPFENTLIVAWGEPGALRIEGLAHSGPAWLAPSWGGRHVVPVWTVAPIVHVTGPGRLAVRTAGKLVGALERGALADTTLDVFESAWLVSRFCAREATLLTRTASQHLLRRAIQLVRGARHGGMILFVESSEQLHGLRLKYRFAGGEPARRFHTLLSRLAERLSSPQPAASWEAPSSDDDPAIAAIEESIFELSRLIAQLAATDGAVVLDKHFALIGFGAEVSAELPTPSRVWQALDLEGRELRAEQVESVGTRHRAAYRFALDHARGVAVVISHDGAVRFVASRGEEVLYWEQSVSP